MRRQRKISILVFVLCDEEKGALGEGSQKNRWRYNDGPNLYNRSKVNKAKDHCVRVEYGLKGQGRTRFDLYVNKEQKI